jgi:hypothetical protein
MFGENKVSLPHIDRTSGLGAVYSSLGPYVRHFTTSRTSGKIPYVRYVGSRGELHFLFTVYLFADF